jgi:phosphohistidine phosphatase SixA
VRARQTAEIAVAAWQTSVRLLEEPSLVDPTPERLARRLSRIARTGRVALFGHEPGVSALLARLLGAPTAESLAFKKGGAALVETARPGKAGSGQLLWLASPAMLRLVGGRR